MSRLVPRHSVSIASALLLWGCVSSRPPASSECQTEKILETTLFDSPTIRYLLYRPTEYDQSLGHWPLILFLHGDGERGSNLDDIKREGLPRLLERLSHFPFLVLSPQSRRRVWSIEALDLLLKEETKRSRIDPARIYLTGLSGGASASLELAARFPDRFAAIAAISPNRSPVEICRMRSTPVWFFHNRGDGRIPLRTPKGIARSLEACGGEVRFTIYPRDDHDAWSETYARSDLYDWFLGHQASKTPAR